MLTNTNALTSSIMQSFTSSNSNVSLSSNADAITVKDNKTSKTFSIDGTSITLNQSNDTLEASNIILNGNSTTTEINIFSGIGIIYNPNTQKLVVGATDIGNGFAPPPKEFFIGENSAASFTKSGAKIIVKHGQVTS